MIATPQDPGQRPRTRNVCHACGFKYPIGGAGAGCCLAPEIHIHNVDWPCDLCREETMPMPVSYQIRYYTRAEIDHAKAQGRRVHEPNDREPPPAIITDGGGWYYVRCRIDRLEHKKRRLQRDMARRRRRGEAIHDSWHSPEARQFLGRRHDAHGQHRHLAAIQVL